MSNILKTSLTSDTVPSDFSMVAVPTAAQNSMVAVPTAAQNSMVAVPTAAQNSTVAVPPAAQTCKSSSRCPLQTVIVPQPAKLVLKRASKTVT